jgi:hypothetical protein
LTLDNGLADGIIIVNAPLDSPRVVDMKGILRDDNHIRSGNLPLIIHPLLYV